MRDIIITSWVFFLPEICKILLKEMSAILKTDVFTYATPTTDLFKIRLQDPSADPDTYIEPNVSEPKRRANALLYRRYGKFVNDFCVNTILGWAPTIHWNDWLSFISITSWCRATTHKIAARMGRSRRIFLWYKRCICRAWECFSIAGKSMWRPIGLNAHQFVPTNQLDMFGPFATE